MLFCAIAIAVLVVVFNLEQEVSVAQAGSEHNVLGYAYSSNFDWISFNSKNCDIDGDGVYEGGGETGGPAPTGCPTSGTAYNYGVNLGDDDNFSGYAWGSNIGWISFGETTGVPSFDSSACSSCSGCSACLGSDNKVYGWAKVLSLGDEGWLSFGNESGDVYGVSFDNSTKEFEGYAWNSYDDEIGIGWLSFNCNEGSESGGSVCTTSGYKVQLLVTAPDAPTNLTASASDCDVMRLDWDDNSDNETGFEAERSVNGVDWVNFCNVGVGIDYCSGSVSPSTSYQFRVKALGDGGDDSDWSNLASASTSFCAPHLSLGDYNCDGVTLNWSQQGSGITSYEIYRNETGGDPWGTPIATVGSSTFTYTDTSIESGKKYHYKVVAQSGNKSSNVVPVTPCQKLPGWKETKPGH